MGRARLKAGCRLAGLNLGTISDGHAFVQNLRRGHDEPGADLNPLPSLS